MKDRHLPEEGADCDVVDILQVGVVEYADNGVVDDASATHGILTHDDAAPASIDGRELPLGVKHPAVDESRNISVVPLAASPVELG